MKLSAIVAIAVIGSSFIAPSRANAEDECSANLDINGKYAAGEKLVVGISQVNCGGKVRIAKASWTKQEVDCCPGDYDVDKCCVPISLGRGSTLKLSSSDIGYEISASMMVTYTKDSGEENYMNFVVVVPMDNRVQSANNVQPISTPEIKQADNIPSRAPLLGDTLSSTPFYWKR